MSLYHINFWNICCMLHIICLKIFLLTSNFHCHSHFFVAALYWYCNDWGFNRTKVTTKYRCNHWRSQPKHLEAHSQAKNLLQARSNGHSGAVFPHIFIPPKCCCERKICFKHIIKAKILPPYNAFPPQTLKLGYGPGGPKCLILGEQQYFVWDTTTQSTKWLDILNILWGHCPWLRLWV